MLIIKIIKEVRDENIIFDREELKFPQGRPLSQIPLAS